MLFLINIYQSFSHKYVIITFMFLDDKSGSSLHGGNLEFNVENKLVYWKGRQESSVETTLSSTWSRMHVILSDGKIFWHMASEVFRIVFEINNWVSCFKENEGWGCMITWDTNDNFVPRSSKNTWYVLFAGIVNPIKLVDINIISWNGRLLNDFYLHAQALLG